jgi:hypothetical protein
MANYDMIRVSKIERATKEIITKVAENYAKLKERIQDPNYDGDRDISMIHFYEGIPMKKPLHDFITRFVTTYKHYRVGVHEGSRTTWVVGRGLVGFSEVSLYVPGERYARGRIGYGDFRVGNGNEDVYMVYNHTISNNKYKPGREQYHMLMTTNQDTALKAVYKNMKPFSLAEIAEEERDDIRRKVTNLQDDRKRAYRNLFDDMIKGTAMTELRLAYQSGYKFSSMEFAKSLEEYFAKKDESDREIARKHKAQYVYISEANGEQYAEILECDDAKEYGAAQYGAQTKVKMSEIPVDIAGKIAVLSMVDDRHYVEGVGMKISTDAYWVERTND